MSRKSRNKLIGLMYDALEDLGNDISPTEIYGVMENVKMGVRDNAMIEIEKSKEEGRKPRWIK